MYRDKVCCPRKFSSGYEVVLRRMLYIMSKFLPLVGNMVYKLDCVGFPLMGMLLNLCSQLGARTSELHGNACAVISNNGSVSRAHNKQGEVV